MNIIDIHCYPGKNIHCHRPVIKATVDLEDIYDTPTKDLMGFNEKLTERLPGISNHYCSCGYEGGFAERLREGTYPAHVTEHITLELQTLAGYNVRFGRSRLVKEPSIYSIAFEYVNDKCAVECLLAAVEIFNTLAAGGFPDIGEILKRIMAIAAETDPGPSTRAICEAAVRHGIPVTRLGDGSIHQLGYGKYSRLVEASLTDTPACVSVDMAGNKQLTKEMLSMAGIPVPHGMVAYSLQAAVSAAERIGYPVVLKPSDANQGKGVAIDIRCREEVEEAYRRALQFSKSVLVENCIRGNDYRVLVVGGRVSAASERIPPSVAGDGRHSVKELVDAENRSELRGYDHEKPLTRINLDETALKVLEKNGKNPGYVPAEGERVLLRYNGNLSTGGTARDCTDELHPANAEIAIKAAEVMGLDIAGVDITAEDISCPIHDGSGAVIEVNAAPGLRMHLYPSIGEKRRVDDDIIRMLFPRGQPCSIPIISVTGTNGKTTTTRLIAHAFSLMGRVTGMTTTSGVYIGGECVLQGDNTGPVSARIVLSDRRVEAAVLETARGGIIRRGLGYDLADVGVVVNISEDHLGIDGVNTLEELAHVKSLVVEAVKPAGYAVLNADDAMTPYLMNRTGSRIVLFSQSRRNKRMEQHIKSGGKAVYLSGGTVCIYDGKSEQQLLDAEKIPITFGGLAACNVENALAAASALFAAHVPLPVIKAALKTFRPDETCNPGRLNVFDLGNCKVMLDYGHNPAGFKAVSKLLSDFPCRRIVGIIGMPGDRTDESIREAGVICAGVFSRIYIKEDRDLRGRNPGEVADLFYDAVIKAGMDKSGAEIVYSELEALRTAIRNAQNDDLIVMFYEEFEPAYRFVSELAESIPAGVEADGEGTEGGGA